MHRSHRSQNLLSRRHFALAALSLPIVAAGCSLPGEGPAPRRVRLSPATDFPPNLPSVGWALKVQEPDATLSLNTALIAYVKTQGEVEYVSGAEWASRAPEMVMELLTKSFENSNMILTVGDRRSRVRPNFELELELRQFIFRETDSNAGEARVEMNTRLVQHPRRNSAGSFVFSAQSTVAEVNIDNIVAAFDDALQSVMVDIVEWTLRTGAGVA